MNVYFYRAEIPGGKESIGIFEWNDPRTILSKLRSTLNENYQGECFVLSISPLGKIDG